MEHNIFIQLAGIYLNYNFDNFLFSALLWNNS